LNDFGVYLDLKNIQIDLHMRKAIALGERVRGEECATKVLLGKTNYLSKLFF
jgi:hypothetical protein